MADSKPAGSRILVAALAFLGGVTGVVFGRVFTGTHPAVRLALAGVLAVAIAAALARRPLVVSLAASAAGLVFVLGALVFPATTWLGIPTPSTIAAIVDTLTVVTQRAATEVAPAPPLDALMTASMMAIWSASTASHALSVRSGSSLLPLLPAAGLLGFVGVVTEEPPRPGYVVLFLVAAFAVLFAEAQGRASSWGSRSGRAAFSGRWARVLGGGAALAAIAIPGLLPGFGGRALLDVRGGQGQITVSPIVDIRPSLLRNPVADLFSVRADRPAYWRLAVLDEFDGRLWTPSETQETGLVELSPGVETVNAPSSASNRPLEQEIEIHELATPWLPAAGDPMAVSLEDDLGARYDTRSGVIELESETSDGMRYSVMSSQAWPSLRTLERLIPTNPLGDPRYTALPPEVPDRIREIAIDVAGRSETEFEAVLAIQNYLRSFTYDENARAGHGVNDMVHFLEVTRRGYCEQFAAAMAVMVRSLGLPARVAIGFLPGELDRTGRYRVTTAQVHAWPEVHFGEYGWLAFEPTPGRNNPSASYLLPPSQRITSEGRTIDGGASEPGSLSAVELRESFVPGSIEQPEAGPRARVREEPFSWRRLVLVAVVIVLALALLIPPARAVWRRAVLRGAGSGRQQVLAAYAWLLDGAARLQLGREKAETPAEYVRRLAARPGFPAASLARVTSLAERALYSDREPGREEGAQAVTATRQVLHEMRRGAGGMRALAGALRPRPL